MPIRPTSAGKKTANKKAKKLVPKDDDEIIPIDHRQIEIDGLIREREEIRAKLNTICSKILDNINIDNYPNDIDLTKQQPSDIAVEHFLTMIDEICEYRTAFLNLYQETDDNEHISVTKKITQLSIEDPNLFGKRLRPEQRLTFVVRERDLWKENAELLQIMYATVVDQLETGMFKKITNKTSEILRAHRLNLEEVCLIFSAPLIRSIHDVRKSPEKKQVNQKLKNEQISLDVEQEELNPSAIIVQNEMKDNSSVKMKRNVSFAEEVNIFYDNKELPEQQQQQQQQHIEKVIPTKSRLPSANETLIDKMDSNLRMLIVKELSKDSQVFQPSSKKSSHTTRDVVQSNRSRKKLPEWVTLAQLIGINESEVDHWLSQCLQYPASRVLSTWCNCTSPSPTVAELHSLVSSNELNRVDLARQIETMYHI